jgi:hypothetical protein
VFKLTPENKSQPLEPHPENGQAVLSNLPGLLPSWSPSLSTGPLAAAGAWEDVGWESEAFFGACGAGV